MALLSEHSTKAAPADAIEAVAPSKVFVLAAVGTDHHPFDRFVDWIDTWQNHHSECDVFVQRGSTDRVPKLTASAKWLEPDALDAMMHSAGAIICHGGPSTIMEARRAGVMPVVIPRDPALGEHVDDHQLRFTEFMAAKGAILLAHTQVELAGHLDDVLRGSVERVPLGSPEPTLERITAVIDELMERPRRSRSNLFGLRS